MPPSGSFGDSSDRAGCTSASRSTWLAPQVVSSTTSACAVNAAAAESSLKWAPALGSSASRDFCLVRQLQSELSTS